MSFIQDYREAIDINNIAKSQRTKIDAYKMKAAMYKACFFHRNDLALKLRNQIEENENALIGEFDGFSYSSVRAKATYRNLNDMYDQGILTKYEYNFCNV